MIVEKNDGAQKTFEPVGLNYHMGYSFKTSLVLKLRKENFKKI